MTTATKVGSTVKKNIRKTVKREPVNSELESGRDSVADAYGNLRSAKDHFKSATIAAGGDIKHEADEKIDQGVDKAREMYMTTENYVKAQPLTSAGIAFATGVIISRILGK